MSDKIKPHHLERKAILYVRQSSAYQVQNNLESQKLQYAMRDKLCSLGWRDISVLGPCGCGCGKRKHHAPKLLDPYS